MGEGALQGLTTRLVFRGPGLRIRAGSLPVGCVCSCSAAMPRVRLRNDTSTQPRLDSESILAASAAEPSRLSVFMCGLAAMLRDLRRQLKSAGVPARHLRHE